MDFWKLVTISKKEGKQEGRKWGRKRGERKREGKTGREKNSKSMIYNKMRRIK